MAPVLHTHFGDARATSRARAPDREAPRDAYAESRVSGARGEGRELALREHVDELVGHLEDALRCPAPLEPHMVRGAEALVHELGHDDQVHEVVAARRLDVVDLEACVEIDR